MQEIYQAQCCGTLITGVVCGTIMLIGFVLYLSGTLSEEERRRDGEG